jgi:hypothetical protein
VIKIVQQREWVTNPETGKEYLCDRIGECHCGEQLYLDCFTNTCEKCGADYNSAGQELAPRSQWGYETGESVQDILDVDSDGFDPWDEDY